MDDKTIERAGRIIKVLKLQNSYPSDIMDEVAISLNSGLTYDEKEEAAAWARAFELATQEGSIRALAEKMHR